MIKVKDKNKTIYFANKKDADNYNDYLQNGLKVTRKDGRTYHYNDGSKLIDISMQGETRKRYVLHHSNKRIASEKLQKKYIQAITLNHII